MHLYDVLLMSTHNRNKKNYPRIITKYSSLIIPLFTLNLNSALCIYRIKGLTALMVVVGHRLEIIIDHRLASVAAADAIFRL